MLTKKKEKREKEKYEKRGENGGVESRKENILMWKKSGTKGTNPV